MTIESTELPSEGLALPPNEAQLRELHEDRDLSRPGKILTLLGAAGIVFGLIAKPAEGGDGFLSFAAWGFALVVFGLLLQKRASGSARLRRLRQASSTERPWESPGLWSNVARVQLMRLPSRRLLVVTLLATAAVLVAGIVVVVMGVRIDWKWGCSFLVALFVFRLTLRRLRRYAAIGFTTFPWFVGERAVLRIAFEPGRKGDFVPAELLLRCIRESAAPKPVRWEVRVMHAVPAVACVPVEGRPRVYEAAFDIPAGLPGTDHTATPAWRWDLVMLADDASGRRVAVTPVPVYARRVAEAGGG